MTMICEQTVRIVDLGPNAPVMQRYRVEVLFSGNVKPEPIPLFVSKWTDELEAMAIFREHASHRAEFHEKLWGAVQYPKQGESAIS